MSRMFGYPETNREGICLLTSIDGEYKEMMMDIAVYDLKQGEVREFSSADKELAILLLEGDICLQWEGRLEKAVRNSFIKEGPYCLHVSCRQRVVVKTDSGCEFLIQASINDRLFPSHYYKPSDCSDVISGKGLCNEKAVRIVRTIFDYHNAPYSNMVLGEVVSEQGGWTSYIPHHHPQPEVYFYRYERPEGFGACFIGDEAFKVTDRSFAAIPGGLTHPQVTAPGYPMYYVWMIRHLDNNPWTDRIDDTRYLWLLEEK